MKDVVFVTGNQHKAEHIQKLLGIAIESLEIDLEEIQSINLKDVIEHKVRQAYDIIKRPVFVDDFSLWLDELDGLPGPFIKFFINSKNGLENTCRIADSLPSRRATARSYMGYYDGSELKIFYGEIKGEIAMHPRGDADFAFGSDPIFSVDGYQGRTRAEVTRSEYDAIYSTVRPITKFREFLTRDDNGK